jgi:ubiquinone/menaquinone biosynthesis C-methylase UbiE
MGTELDRREAVRRAYSAAASDPGGDHPFDVGRELALGVGYPASLLDRLPEASVAAFAGVRAVSLEAELGPGDRVLDLGCGGGLDSLVAAERVGPGGRVAGVDFSAEMLGRARRARDEVGAGTLGLLRASAEALPLSASSVDVALVNGIFNLNPARLAILAELARVVAPGGRVHAAELVLREALPPSELTEASWFA